MEADLNTDPPHDGARAGSRTLNLGIKRRLTFIVRKRQDVSRRASRTRRSDAFVPQSVLECHRLPSVSCHISCHPGPRIADFTRAHRAIVEIGTVRFLLAPPSGCQSACQTSGLAIAS